MILSSMNFEMLLKEATFKDKSLKSETFNINFLLDPKEVSSS